MHKKSAGKPPLRATNGAFQNNPPVPQLRQGMTRFGLFKKFVFEKSIASEPQSPIPIVPITTDELRHQQGNADTHIYRIGHSTMLFKLGQDYWLTDPVFSNRASPNRWLGPKRFHQPPISIEDLPPIKGVIISHNHYDHLDKSAIKQLSTKVEKFVVSLGIADILISWGIDANRITELAWWDSCHDGGVCITATPSQHFSGRGLNDTNKTLWSSFVLQYNNRQLFFGSDSGYFSGFRLIGDAFGPFDVTMLETGAYDSAWPNVHMTPEESIKAHMDLGGNFLMPIHNSTFKLSFHPWKEPLERITELAAPQNISVLTPVIGERYVVGQKNSTEQWWRERK